MKSPLVPPRHVSRQPNCWRCERQQELYMTSPKCWTQVPNNACASCCGCKLPGLFHHWRLSVPRSWRISLRSLPSAAGRPARAAKPLPASPGVHSIPLSKWQDQLMLRREWLRRNPMKAGSKGDSCLRQQKNLLQCPAFGQDEWHTYYGDSPGLVLRRWALFTLPATHVRAAITMRLLCCGSPPSLCHMMNALMLPCHLAACILIVPHVRVSCRNCPSLDNCRFNVHHPS